MSEWVHVGDVVIESGRLALVDPDLADEVVNLEGTGDVVVGAPGLIVSTGLGDGRYAVQVLYEDYGESIGRRIACVQVWFMDTPDDEED